MMASLHVQDQGEPTRLSTADRIASSHQGLPPNADRGHFTKPPESFRLHQPKCQTPQEPPKPMVTFSPSTMTGTFRVPPEIFSIASRFWGDAFTSM